MIVQNFPTVGLGFVSLLKSSGRLKTFALIFVLGLLCFQSSAQITINGSGSYATISSAVAAASAGDVIDVPAGTYTENVLINKQNLTLRSIGGKAVTTIQGITASGAGAVMIANGINGVKIGQAGKGFTIIGFDGNGAIESAALYLLGAHTNITIEGNEIRANGDHGLLSNFNAAIDGITIKGNDFTGQTFLGSTPGGCGFIAQFNVGNNVPRQLVTMGGGGTPTLSKNVFFLNNNVTGCSGGYNLEAGCTATGQGNNLVTIDVIGCLISGNTFNGVTTRFGYSLRTRGPNASISCNTFYSGGLAASCGHIFLGTANPFTGANPSTLAGIATANGFPNGGAYLTPNNANSYQIYLNNAQATAAATGISAGQSVVNCSATTNCPVQNVNTGLLFSSIQSAINDPSTLAGHFISVGTGNFNEDVTVNKSITLQGAGCGNTIISGPIGGGGATIQVGAAGVIVDGFTITRDGNNTTDWNNTGLNFAGVAIQGLTNNAEIRNCCITGNRTGIDINNSNGNNIHNNLIDNNRTGLIFRNQTDNTNVQNNFITNNWTLGVLFLDASSGTNSPVQSAINSTFNNNNISGNWYGQVQDRQTGGSLPAPGSNLKNFTCNWYGSTSISTSSSNSSEPGYVAQIPVVFGGTATAPGGQPDLLGTALANITYIAYLTNGTDDQPGTFGFQPVLGSCNGSTNLTLTACPTDVSVQCASQVPAPNIALVSATGTCPGISVVHQGDNISNQTCTNKFTLTRTYKVTDNCSNQVICTQIITVNDNTNPTITTTSVDANLGCNPNVVAPVFSGTDNCDGVISPNINTSGPQNTSGCFYSQTWTATYSDACGNAADPVSITYTWTQDLNGPQFTNCTNITTPNSSGTCSAVVNFSTPSATDDCSTPSIVQTDGLISGSVFPLGISTVTFKATDACGNTTYCNFTVTVTQDPTTSVVYTILAKEEVHLHTRNVVNGNVGVWQAGKAAKIHDYTNVTGFVRAPVVDKDATSTIGGGQQITQAPEPSAASFRYNTAIDPSSDINIPDNFVGTYNLIGNNFRKITVGKNSTAQFVSSGDIFIKELIIKDADNNKVTTLLFSGNSELMIRKTLDIGKRNRINQTGGHSVKMYVEENDVKVGGSSVVRASIDVRFKNLLPENATATSQTLMIGQYIAKKVDSKDYVIWNSICVSPVGPGLPEPEPESEADVINNRLDEIITNYGVRVYPNPNSGLFDLEINSPDFGTMNVTVYNYLGQVVKSIKNFEYHNLTTLNLDLRNEASTYYIVKVEMPGETMYRKVIIAK